MGLQCRQIELGRSGSIAEIEIKWEGSPIPRPVKYHRTSSMVAFAEICAPSDLLDQYWHDIVNCAIAAAAAAGVTVIIAGPETATPVVELAFTPCLAERFQDRAKEVQIALSTQQKPNEDWHQ